MNDLTFMILKIIVSVSMALITLYLVPFLQGQVKNRQEEELLKIIDVAVRAAEQTLTGGSVKKADVLCFVSKWLGDHNIAVTDEQLDKLIEAAVYSMNNTQSVH